MTALNVVIGTDSAHLISDGAAIDPASGRLAHLIGKVTAHPHLAAAVGVRGSRMLASGINDAIASGASSYDELRSTIVPMLRQHLAPIAPIWEKQFGPNIMSAEIVAVGWSESVGPHAFVVATHSANADFGLPAWRVVELPGAYFSPSNEQLANEFAEVQTDFNDSAAVKLVEQQRSIRAQTPGTLSKRCTVGGFVQITTVRESSVEARIVKRWPDEIGSIIKPAAIDRFATRNEFGGSQVNRG